MCYGSFITCMRNFLGLREPEICLLVLGLENSGKSALVSRICMEPHKQSPNYKTVPKELRIKEKKLHLWDLSGQLTMRQYWRNYYSSANALIYVVDSTDAARLAEARCVLCDVLMDKRLASLPLLVLANKQDLNNSLNGTDVIDLLGLGQMTKSNWLLQECSAKLGMGFQDGLEWICHSVPH